MVWYVVDGMDGSGKTTSSNHLRDSLEAEGRKVLEITHPNVNCVFGRLAARCLCIPGKLAQSMSTILYIFDVLHSLHIRKWYGRKYDDIIFVRYSMAAAYLPESACAKAYAVIEKVLPVPDVKIFVDIEPEIAMKRIIERGEELEVFETVEKLGKTRRKMKSVSGSWHIIDNSGTRENTEAQTMEILEQVRGRR